MNVFFFFLSAYAQHLQQLLNYISTYDEQMNKCCVGRLYRIANKGRNSSFLAGQYVICLIPFPIHYG